MIEGRVGISAELTNALDFSISPTARLHAASCVLRDLDLNILHLGDIVLTHDSFRYLRLFMSVGGGG